MTPTTNVLKVNYYVYEATILPSAGLKSLSPYKTEFVDTINFREYDGIFAGSERFDYVAALFEGQLHFGSGETVRFCLTSDDGSKLFINDQLIIDNDGLHSDQTKCSSGYFSGRVAVAVEFFEHGR